MTASLIEKLRDELLPTGESDERHGWNTAILATISIVRQHFADQPYIDAGIKSIHIGTEAISDEDMAKVTSGEASPSDYGMEQVYPAKASAEVVERVARSIARCHYARKQHYGVCTKDERLDYRVNQYWRQFTADAEAAIAAMGGARETGIGNHASTACQQDHALTLPTKPGTFTTGNLKVAGGATSELRDNAQSEAFNLAVDLGDKLFDMIHGTAPSKYSWNRYEVSKAIEGVILEAMGSYLRTTEPVSVPRSLEKCAKALEDRGIVLVSRYSLNDVVKTVFDASEVQYVD